MLKVAVITGGHHFDVIAFQQLFRALPGIDAYPQHMADFVASSPEVRAQYATLVFYTHLKHEGENLGLSPGSSDTFRSVLESLGQTPQGIVVLHHGLLAFPDWSIWDDVVGIPDRTLHEYAHDEMISYHLADAAHPVCAGLADWTMTDETYLMTDAAADNHILVTTDHPRSMTTLAWVRQHRLSRVFCLQAGHDQTVWKQAQFQTLLRQGIRWCAPELDI
jgi:hypothetical protein